MPARERWYRLLHSADEIVLVSEQEYYDGCMQKRNRYMVDNSSKIIAVYNNTKGGTEQTINYAISQEKEIIIVKP